MIKQIQINQKREIFKQEKKEEEYHMLTLKLKYFFLFLFLSSHDESTVKKKEIAERYKHKRYVDEITFFNNNFW